MCYTGTEGVRGLTRFFDKCGFVEMFFEIPDGMTQGYDFPEEAVRRGRQVLGFANTPAKGNALFFYVEKSGRDDARL